MNYVPEDADLRARAYAFDKLAQHLQLRSDVQNIDVMILAGFCRNCLSKWWRLQPAMRLCRASARTSEAATTRRAQVSRGRPATWDRHEL